MFLRILLIALCLLFVNICLSQNIQIERIFNDSIKTPPVQIKGMERQGLIWAPDQIGFGKLYIDTLPPVYTMRQRILDSAYRSTSLFVKLYEKDFKKWEQKVYAEEDAKKEAIKKLNPFPLKYDKPMQTGIRLGSIFSFWDKKNYGYMPADKRLEYEGELKRILAIDRERRRKKKEAEEQKKKETEKIEGTSFTIPLPDIKYSK